jgi:cytochrome c556
MARFHVSVLLASLPLAVVSCDPAADRSDAARDSALAIEADSPAHVAGAATDERAGGGREESGHAAGGHAASTEAGQALLPIMQRLGSEMTALTYALMTEDDAAVTRSAAAIAEHAPISAEELERIRAELGADMARFEAVDESVHVASVRLHEAARARQPDLAVQRLGEVQRGCVSCHVQFRERLRTNRSGR